MTDLAPDLAVARRFLSALTGEENPLCCFQTFADDKNWPDEKKRPLAGHRHLRAAAAMAWLVEKNDAGAGIYVTVNLTDGQGREAKNIVGLRALFVDGDDVPMPSTWAIAPSIVVRRDAVRWHAYWLLQPGEQLGRFKRAQAQLAVALGTDPKVKDLPRVMRVPGFLHRKHEPPADVHLVTAEASLRYTVDQVLAAYPLPTAVELNDEGQVIREGTRTAATPPRPRPPSSSEPTYGHLLELTRKYAAELDTTPGAGNSRGGQDNTAFYLACECNGRGISHDDAIDLVLDYLRRCSYVGADEAVQRIVRSAYSRQRSATLPAMPSGKRASSSAASSSSAAPPSRPPGPPDEGGGGGGGGDDAGAGDDEGNPFKLDLVKLEKIWAISGTGVWPIEYSARNERHEPRPNKRVCDLPIWPVRAGFDVAGGPTWWELAWWTPEGETMRAWLPEADLKSGIALVALRDAPVVKRHCEACAAWLTAARGAVTTPPATITTRVGWCGRGDMRTWVWPVPKLEARHVYIGGDLAPAGELAKWREGVDHLLSLPDDDPYPALTVLGFSIGAAFSRLVGARNPVLGLMHPTSSGKGSTIAYGLSLWCNPDLLTLPASSTAKGVQDRGHAMPDSPLWLDELQQLAEKEPKLAADALYYLANGQRRVTSSKDQQATGGERRFGCGFYAAESPVLVGQNRGVLYRIIELTGAPCPTQQTAEILQRATQAYGALAGELTQRINAKPAAEWRAELDRLAEQLRGGREDLKGDDAKQLALCHLGLQTLFSALQVTPADDRNEPLPDAIARWLTRKVVEQRRNASDRETEALFSLITLVLSGRWGISDPDRPVRDVERHGPCSLHVSTTRDGYLAWKSLLFRQGQPEHDQMVTLEVNPSAEPVRRLLAEFGGEQRLLAAWARSGWIRRDGRHLKVHKAYQGERCGRVIAFTELALQVYQAPGDASDGDSSPPDPHTNPTRPPHTQPVPAA